MKFIFVCLYMCAGIIPSIICMVLIVENLASMRTILKVFLISQLSLAILISVVALACLVTYQ